MTRENRLFRNLNIVYKDNFRFRFREYLVYNRFSYCNLFWNLLYNPKVIDNALLNFS